MTKNWLYYATGFTLIIAFMGVLIVLSVHEIPERNRELFAHLLGMIDGAFITGLVGSFFGSSKKEHEIGTTNSVEITQTTKQETE